SLTLTSHKQTAGVCLDNPNRKGYTSQYLYTFWHNSIFSQFAKIPRGDKLVSDLNPRGERMSIYSSKKFWVDTLDRAVSTTAQAAVAVLTANVTGILDVDWAQIASVSGLAGLVSVLTSVAFRGQDK